MKEGIIFDLDGTLINSLPLHVESFLEIMKEQGIKGSKREIEKMMGLPTSHIFRFLKKKYGLKGKIKDLREERRYHYFEVLGKKNIVFPGVFEKLKELKKEYSVAVATGSSKIVLLHSTPKIFYGLFDGVVTINDVKRGKPSPDQFLLAARKLRLNPSNCIVVGDSIYDGAAAKRAGMKFIGVTTGYESKTNLSRYAEEVVKSIKDLNFSKFI